MSILANTAIIGKLPGYNKNIDTVKNDFQKNLLKGVTFIDMYPTSYQNVIVTNTTTGTNNSADLKNLLNKEKLNELLRSPALFKRETEKSMKTFQSVLARMQETYTYLGSDFAGAKTIRIVAANDSTFAETFTNNFSNVNGIQGLYNKAKNSKAAQLSQVFSRGLQSMSHANMLDLVGSSLVGNDNNFATVMQGAAFGMNLTSPAMWSDSSYSSNLTIFIKLVAPVGTKKCIQEHILKPLMYLLAASSPITARGLVTGIPLLWEVQAQGVTNFRLGAINSMSVIRGSFETTFNTDLQPTVLDVRLNIVPLLTDFATQTMGKDTSMYNETSAEYYGASNPSDIVRGTMNNNTHSGMGAEKIVSIKI